MHHKSNYNLFTTILSSSQSLSSSSWLYSSSLNPLLISLITLYFFKTTRTPESLDRFVMFLPSLLHLLVSAPAWRMVLV